MTTEYVDKILGLAASRRASDVHFFVGKKPLMRVDGVLMEIEEEEQLQANITEELVYSMLSPQRKQRFIKERELDFAYQIPNGVRFRVNIHWERGYVGMVARVIPMQIPTMEDLGMPDIVYELTRLKQGLVLVTGPTGCGKSTSLAAMINLINKERREHIITLEDPIEYIFTSDKSLIRQREMDRDFLSFSTALKHVVRQDPNIIMVGEMRDLETISAALTVAETGHLVFATLHTLGSSETIDRIIDVFPPYQQEQIRLQLSMELRAVVSQQLVPRVGGGRVAAREVMINTSAVSNLIRENKIPQLQTVLQTSADSGMITLDLSLKKLHDEGLVDRDLVSGYMQNPSLLDE
ncbi:MAG: type IV pilus twitching motility protein PilT [bacterium]|nr:type IV pilus twitching motility protein PilT [bacterium]